MRVCAYARTHTAVYPSSAHIAILSDDCPSLTWARLYHLPGDSLPLSALMEGLSPDVLPSSFLVPWLVSVRHFGHSGALTWAVT